MNFSDKALVNKLAVVLVLKLALIFSLWWFFVRDQRVVTSSEIVAVQILAPVTTAQIGSKK
jgi:membrane protein YdbS with pleckstrin-like domain